MQSAYNNTFCVAGVEGLKKSNKPLPQVYI